MSYKIKLSNCLNEWASDISTPTIIGRIIKILNLSPENVFLIRVIFEQLFMKLTESDTL